MIIYIGFICSTEAVIRPILSLRMEAFRMQGAPHTTQGQN